MSIQHFSKKEAIKYGWKTARKNLRFYIGLLIILLLVQIGPNVLKSSFGQDDSASLLAFLIGFAFWVLQLVVGLGIIKINLDIHDHKKVKYLDLLSKWQMALNYFLSSLLYGVIVVAGLLLFIIPGIIWAIKFQYFSYFIADKELTPIEALKASSKITKGVKWNLLLFRLLVLLINIGGFITLGVGLLFTIPTGMLAEAYVFRKLESK